MTTETIKYCIANRELKLSFSETYSHYNITGFSIIFLASVSCFILPNYVNYESYFGLFVLLLILFFQIILIFVIYKKEHECLIFKEVSTNLTREQLAETIGILSIKHNWRLEVISDDYVLVKSNPNKSNGEQITILFDGNKVLVNSICDLDRRMSIGSAGQNELNENLVLDEISNAVAN